MKNMKRNILLMVLGFMPLQVKAEAVAQVLGLGAGARAAGMGEAFSSVANDASAIYWNPAGTLLVRSASIVLMHAAYFDSTSYDYAAFVKSNQKRAFGASVQYLSYGDIQKTDNTTTSIGSFTPNDLVATVSLSQQLPFISLGVSGKYIQSKIIDSASTFAGDIGLLTKRYGNNKIRHALTVSNLGGTLKFDSVSEDLPIIYRFGNALYIKESWVLSVDGIRNEDKNVIAFGTEIIQTASNGWRMMGRAGYNTQYKDAGSGAGLSFGLGIGINSFNINYAFAPFGDLGDSHKFAIGWDFGKYVRS
ncbi:MAG: PorV/PorQ family protein [Elusimicrobiota bacterium]